MNGWMWEYGQWVVILYLLVHGRRDRTQLGQDGELWTKAPGLREMVKTRLKQVIEWL